MNENQLFDVCDSLGLRSGPAYTGSDKWGPHVSISCPLAPIRHNDPYDYNLSCSVSVSEEDPSLVRCFSFNCQYKGSFYNMLKLLVEFRGNPADLVALLQKLEPTEKFTIDSRNARAIKKYEAEQEQLRRPSIPAQDKDTLPEARLERYRTGVPRYALDRGLTIESCKAWELGYDKNQGRLIFPVRRYDGALVGLTGRILPSAARRAEQEGRVVSKYHNYAGLDKAKFLYGEHKLEVKKPVVLCEGQIDAILITQFMGLPAVAPLGEGFSEKHVRTICAHEPPVVYIFPDNDPPGRLAAEKFVYAFKGRLPLKLVMPPPGLDPGECSEDQMQHAFSLAAPILGKKIKWSEVGA